MSKVTATDFIKNTGFDEAMNRITVIYCKMSNNVYSHIFKISYLQPQYPHGSQYLGMILNMEVLIHFLDSFLCYSILLLGQCFTP